MSENDWWGSYPVASSSSNPGDLRRDSTNRQPPARNGFLSDFSRPPELPPPTASSVAWNGEAGRSSELKVEAEGEADRFQKALLKLRKCQKRRRSPSPLPGTPRGGEASFLADLGIGDQAAEEGGTGKPDTKWRLDDNKLFKKELLPEGWVGAVHESSMPVYLHRESRVVTFGMPFPISGDEEEAAAPPVGSVPCLAWKKGRKLAAHALAPGELKEYCSTGDVSSSTSSSALMKGGVPVRQPPFEVEFFGAAGEGKHLTLKVVGFERALKVRSRTPRAILASLLGLVWSASPRYDTSPGPLGENSVSCKVSINSAPQKCYPLSVTAVAYGKERAKEEAALTALETLVSGSPFAKLGRRLPKQGETVEVTGKLDKGDGELRLRLAGLEGEVVVMKKQSDISPLAVLDRITDAAFGSKFTFKLTADEASEEDPKKSSHSCSAWLGSVCHGKAAGAGTEEGARSAAALIAIKNLVPQFPAGHLRRMEAGLATPAGGEHPVAKMLAAKKAFRALARAWLGPDTPLSSRRGLRRFNEIPNLALPAPPPLEHGCGLRLLRALLSLPPAEVRLTQTGLELPSQKLTFTLSPGDLLQNQRESESLLVHQALTSPQLFPGFKTWFDVVEAVLKMFPQGLGLKQAHSLKVALERSVAYLEVKVLNIEKYRLFVNMEDRLARPLGTESGRVGLFKAMVDAERLHHLRPAAVRWGRGGICLLPLAAAALAVDESELEFDGTRLWAPEVAGAKTELQPGDAAGAKPLAARSLQLVEALLTSASLGRKLSTWKDVALAAADWEGRWLRQDLRRLKTAID